MNTPEKREELKRWLKAKKLTQVELAEMFGMSQANTSMMLSGRVPFSADTARAWEARLGIRAAWLILGDGTMFPLPPKTDDELTITSLVREVRGLRATIDRLISEISTSTPKPSKRGFGKKM